MTKTLSRILIFVVFTTAATVSGEAVATAKEYNFEKYASKRGCASIVFDSRRSDCKARQKEKNVACKERRLTCDVGKAEKLVKSYEDLKKKLPSLNTADLPSAVSKIKAMKKQLDETRALGKRGIPLAVQCVRNRSMVQSLFTRTIPLTEQAGKNAIEKRKKLLEQLEDAKKKREEAKKQKDKAKRGDDGPKKEWEKAKERVGKLETQLTRFKEQNGRDIQRNVSRLVNHYKDERTRHEQPTANDKTHVENCKKLSELKYSE